MNFIISNCWSHLIHCFFLSWGWRTETGCGRRSRDSEIIGMLKTCCCWKGPYCGLSLGAAVWRTLKDKMGFQLKRLALFFRECFVHLMFLIISFPRASKKPEDQQVSVLSDAQANTGRVSICLFFVVLVVPGASEQMYLYQIWLGFSDQKKRLLFLLSSLWKVLKIIFQHCWNISEEKEKRRWGGEKHSIFLTCRLVKI